LKKWCKIWGFRAKNPVLWSKSSEKFGNWFFRMFGNFGNFGNLKIPKFPKITKKWRLTRNSKIAKNSFRLENRLESSVKSSECRALIPITLYNNSLLCYNVIGLVILFYFLCMWRYNRTSFEMLFWVTLFWVEFTFVMVLSFFLRNSKLHCDPASVSCVIFGTCFKWNF